jgi:DHA2 family methylenomycin A resistance protein-like MFS transporter
MKNMLSEPDRNPLRPNVPMTLAATSLGFAVVQLDGSILNVALSQIGISLGTDINDLQWTVDAYFVAFAVLLLSAGSLSDRWGARRAFVSGFIVFSLASLASGLAPNVAVLIAARTVQGAGAALLVPCSLALLNGVCRDDAGLRARAVGLWTAAGGVGIAAGPILGGLLIAFFGWRSIFLIGGLLLLVTTIISVISAQVSQESTKWSARFVREFRSIPSSVRRRRPEVRRAR